LQVAAPPGDFGDKFWRIHLTGEAKRVPVEKISCGRYRCNLISRTIRRRGMSFASSLRQSGAKPWMEKNDSTHRIAAHRSLRLTATRRII
jgi:hypothetical protein